MLWTTVPHDPSCPRPSCQSDAGRRVRVSDRQVRRAKVIHNAPSAALHCPRAPCTRRICPPTLRSVHISPRLNRNVPGGSPLHVRELRCLLPYVRSCQTGEGSVHPLLSIFSIVQEYHPDLPPYGLPYIRTCYSISYIRVNANSSSPLGRPYTSLYHSGSNWLVSGPASQTVFYHRHVCVQLSRNTSDSAGRIASRPRATEASHPVPLQRRHSGASRAKRHPVRCGTLCADTYKYST